MAVWEDSHCCLPNLRLRDLAARLSAPAPEGSVRSGDSQCHAALQAIWPLVCQGDAVRIRD